MTGADKPETLMQAALEVAQAAGSVALRHFRSPLNADYKEDGSPVTRADREAEEMAASWIQERWPKDAIVGEEIGLRRPEGTRRWIIDPIDGTRTFLKGAPLWGTLIAVSEGQEIIAGAAYFPALGDSLIAARGGGCWLNGVRCSVSGVDNLRDALILTTDTRFAAHRERQTAWLSLSRDVAMTRTWGDCYGYLLVATGRAEAMVDDVVAHWDVSALQVAIEEAGGEFADWLGNRTTFGGDAIATNRALSSVVRKRMGANELL